MQRNKNALKPDKCQLEYENVTFMRNVASDSKAEGCSSRRTLPNRRAWAFMGL